MNRRRRAFTLVELLTVMAIISILIAILTPALSTARNMARATAVRAQISAMEVGLEAFRGAEGDTGEYVPSNAAYYATDKLVPNPEMLNWEVAEGGIPLQGAHLLVDALVGRDFLGYDPKAPPPGPIQPPVYDRWASGNDRRQPFIPTDGMDVTSDDEPPEDAFGGNPATTEVQPLVTGSGVETLLCRVFRDKFGWPILYYRAMPAATQNTPIITTITNPNPNPIDYGDGVYDGLDNVYFTSYDRAGVNEHRIKDAEDDFDDGAPIAVLSNFATFIMSLRATSYDTPPAPPDIIFPRPVKANRFIILSAGRDGIYGNLDDVANFDVLSEQR